MKMKLNIILILFLFLLNTIHSHDIYTQKAHYYIIHDHPAYQSGWDDMGMGWQTVQYWTSFFSQYYDALIEESLGPCNTAYNCHAYAWAGSIEGTSSTWCWLNANNEHGYWTSNSFLEVPRNPFDIYPAGAKISYGDHEHSGVWVGSGQMVSKWGKYGLYRHNVGVDPYDEAPSDIKFYKYYQTYVPQNATITSAISSSLSLEEIYVTASQTLTDNVTLTSNSTLVNQSTGSINLNNKCIYISTGATFTNQGTISGLKAYLKSSTYAIKGYCGSISTACSHASSGDKVEVQSCTFNENISVPTGVTLTIYSGTSINLNGFNVTSSGGTISIQSGASINGVLLKTGSSINGIYPTIQSAINASSSGKTITLLSRTYNENVNISSKSNITITGAGMNNSTISGSVSLSSASGCTISNLLITGNVEMSYGTTNYLSNIKVNGYVCPSYGSNTSLSSVDMISSNNYGLSAGYSYCYVDNCKIKNKSVSGTNASAMTIQFAYCTLCNNNLDVQNTGISNSINLHSCWFSAEEESTSVSGPNITWDTWLDCNDLGKATLGNQITLKEYPSSLEKLSLEKLLEGSSDFEKANAEYNDLFKRINKNNEGNIFDIKQYERDLKNNASQFIKIINDYPGTLSSIKSLQNVLICYRLLNLQQPAKQLVANLLNNDKYFELVNDIKTIMLPLLIDDKNYDGAIKLCDEIISKAPNTSEAPFLLYNKARILETLIIDFAQAESAYNQLIEQYSGSVYANLASAKLGKNISPENSNKQPKKDYLIANNYPNPFNPTTTIAFNLPQNGRAIVKIFDVLGREIVTLLNEQKSAGESEVIWEGKDNFGKDVSSGIYFYNIRFLPENLLGTEQSITMKMLLVR
jgi:tetratricopeptide (TPR) repeat protein